MFRPESTLTYSTANAALEEGLRAIANGQTAIDLGGVTAVDSTAVATLVAWQRAALAKGGALSFANVPDNLGSLLELYGVAHLLRAPAPARAPADLLHH